MPSAPSALVARLSQRTSCAGPFAARLVHRSSGLGNRSRSSGSPAWSTRTGVSTTGPPGAGTFQPSGCGAPSTVSTAGSPAAVHSASRVHRPPLAWSTVLKTIVRPGRCIRPHCSRRSPSIRHRNVPTHARADRRAGRVPGGQRVVVHQPERTPVAAADRVLRAAVGAQPWLGGVGSATDHLPRAVGEVALDGRVGRTEPGNAQPAEVYDNHLAVGGHQVGVELAEQEPAHHWPTLRHWYPATRKASTVKAATTGSSCPSSVQSKANIDRGHAAGPRTV